MSETSSFIARDNLMTRVYIELRNALMEGRLWPGERLKIRPLALQLGVSETPIREALIQLVRERGLIMEAGKAITVPELTLAQYLELRRIRFPLEGMAAEVATPLIKEHDISRMEAMHETIMAAEKLEDWGQAVRSNWHFHHTLYCAAEMPELLALLESLWLRHGPLINYQYPHARPTYAGRHQHLNILDGLRRRDPAAVAAGVQSDMIEGPALLIDLMRRIESGEVDKHSLRRAPATGSTRGRSLPNQPAAKKKQKQKKKQKRPQKMKRLAKVARTS
jgi:DNA-binding GntR family transcriptional regulator